MYAFDRAQGPGGLNEATLYTRGGPERLLVAVLRAWTFGSLATGAAARARGSDWRALLLGAGLDQLACERLERVLTIARACKPRLDIRWFSQPCLGSDEGALLDATARLQRSEYAAAIERLSDAFGLTAAMRLAKPVWALAESLADASLILPPGDRPVAYMQ
ncbi:hypothetical protein [Chitinasiproducens palmae]|uniref:Uncharacterized protein n=1 Tax=Chitinasiproducens palmae TaxID=1770053 RepID=A0A1H2PSG4_9BURK|nr:hypothetical protein [Chitinasiproducens palmae]SDV49918.1 hypothetical protein SAMN05216551_109238 [Chitinasiproducens palmae]